MYCVHCGSENPADATFCQKCGKQLPVTDQDEPTVSSFASTHPASYENTPYAHTPSTPEDTVYASPSTSADTEYAAPPPPSYTPITKEQSQPSELPPAQKPKSRRGLIFTLIIVVLAVIIAAGAYAYVNRSTPDKTVSTYYSALVQNDFQTAYSQFSTAAQGTITEQQFANFWISRGGVKAWTLVSIQEQSSIANATVTVTFGNGAIQLASIALVNENGTWKINQDRFFGG